MLLIHVCILPDQQSLPQDSLWTHTVQTAPCVHGMLRLATYRLTVRTLASIASNDSLTETTPTVPHHRPPLHLL